MRMINGIKKTLSSLRVPEYKGIHLLKLLIKVEVMMLPYGP